MLEYFFGDKRFDFSTSPPGQLKQPQMEDTMRCAIGHKQQAQQAAPLFQYSSLMCFAETNTSTPSGQHNDIKSPGFSWSFAGQHHARRAHQDHL